MIRTRFAPSPTGYLHIGGARTALFSWAFARHYGGQFVLRIEDTDVERSTPEAVQAILDGMQWLGLEADEGPFYQMQRVERYQAVIADMLEAGTAYRCYCSKEELDTLRAEQEARGEKPRYDRRWRPEAGKALPDIPQGMPYVVRFKNPLEGSVKWDDAAQGTIEISNTELDDLIIARSDGTPTYNFCVVVDDWDMNITHVIRGDDHINNTPRQINILKSLGAALPTYAHLPMILDNQGKKLSKRTGAASVMEFQALGYLPEAVLNYLARLGWGHGDDEFFSLAQFVEWFDIQDVSAAASRFDFDKLNWVNQQHLKTLTDEAIADHLVPFLEKKGLVAANLTQPALKEVTHLIRDRSPVLTELAEQASYFYQPKPVDESTQMQHLTAESLELLATLREKLAALEQWDAASIQASIKAEVAERGLKMPKVAMPLRVAVFGTPQTPSIDAALAVLGQVQTLERLSAIL